MAIRSRFQIKYEEIDRPEVTPWGRTQGGRQIAPGIWKVTTATHGGYYLSPQRNNQLPLYLRRMAGWYEQDLDWCRAGVVFSEMCQSGPNEAADYLRNHYPNLYEKFFNVELKPGESKVRDEQAWKESVKDKFVIRHVYGDHFVGVVEWTVAVCAKLGDDPKGPEAWYTIDQTEWDSVRGPYGTTSDMYRSAKLIERPSDDQLVPRGSVVTQEVTTENIKVTLVLTLDKTRRNTNDPRGWNWPVMLELGDGESVTISGVEKY